ncbi:aminotransferase class I/II-fold pyridoxal phosphate-dependent enzyme [Nannocystis pusilla]|uniref:aminotransferase class I/II-fold pyridoxal phosphate-dependent enzyme n=1 Tax=Nannocystis pusilla TaxID=889268 RepID=UPI003DA3EC6D
MRRGRAGSPCITSTSASPTSPPCSRCSPPTGPTTRASSPTARPRATWPIGQLWPSTTTASTPRAAAAPSPRARSSSPSAAARRSCSPSPPPATSAIEILVAEPYYTNYRGFSHLLGVEVVPVSTHARESFAVPPERVRAAITPRTRAFIIPSPGNPTGMVLSAANLAALGEVCVQAGIFFVVDEVYREFVYPDAPTAPDAPAPRAPSVLAVPGLANHAVMIDSVSKRYSACGARVGCLVTRNAALYSACLRFGQARLSPPTVDQYAALAALRTPAADMRAMVDEYRARRNVIVAGLNAIPGVSCPTPTGAFYLITDLPVADAEDFCIFMLRDFDLGGETVMMAPAEGFYATPGLGKNQVRIAYVLGRDKLARCLEILRAGLEAYNRTSR